MQHIKTAWIEAATDWAKQHPEVLEVWFWGSRVSGVSRRGGATRPDSDLDVAVLYSGEDEDEDERIGNDICLSHKLVIRLAPLVGVRIDVQPIDEGHDVVAPERVRVRGLLVYEKGER